MMKKSLLLFATLFAATAFTSCSSDEPQSPDSFDGTYDGKAYMRVCIAMPDGAGQPAGAPSRAGKYENGSAAEQAIKDIGLKFYNSDGSFYGYGHSIENVTVDATTPTTDNNIEGKVAQAICVLQINSNAPKPTHVVAYVNCDEDWKQTNEPDINSIDYTMIGYTHTYEDNVTYYSMTSSNYRGNTSGATASFVQGYQTYISPNCFQPTEAQAIEEGKPVNIYVERLAAKVKVHMADGVNPEDAPIDNGDYALTFKIDGYALGATNTESYYIKHIFEAWSPETLWEGWNSASEYRCFWAADMNYNNTLNTPPMLNYVSYDDVKGKLTGTEGTWLYSTENTQTSLLGEAKTASDAMSAPSRASETDINRYLFQEFAYVIGHYTVTKNGSEVKDPYLYEYAGKILPHDAMLKFMQQSIGNVLFTRTEYGDKVIFEAVDMVEKGYLEIDSYDNDASLVCLKLSTKATLSELSKYYIKKQNNSPTEILDDNPSNYKLVTSLDEVTALLKQSSVQAYGFKYEDNCAGITGNGGYLAYFPILIKHLNPGDENRGGEDARGYYGVVRNHCYDITINSITGLGIGIFNPEVDIIPKDKIKPLYLGATFNVLSWRVVNQTVEL